MQHWNLTKFREALCVVLSHGHSDLITLIAEPTMSDSKHINDSQPSQESPEHSETATPVEASIDANSIEGIFLAALQQPAGAVRDSFLNDACKADAERRQRVAALLRAYDDAGSFMETPAGRIHRSQRSIAQFP